MGQLVVADGQRPAAECVEDLAERARPDREQAGLAQHAIDRHRPADVDVAVLADDPHTGPGRSGGVDQRGAGVVQLADQPGHVAARRPEALGIVIEVRQVDQRQVGPLGLQHLGRCPGDPLRAGQPAARAPEGVEREGAQAVFQSFAEAIRRTGDAEGLVAVGAVMRLWRHAERDVRALIEPPEELGRSERPAASFRHPSRGRVDRLGLEEGIRLLPEPDLARLAEQPAVADDPMALRSPAGEQARLGRAGDGRHDLLERPQPSRACQPVQPGRMRQELRGQSDGVDQDERLLFHRGGVLLEGGMSLHQGGVIERGCGPGRVLGAAVAGLHLRAGRPVAPSQPGEGGPPRRGSGAGPRGDDAFGGSGRFADLPPRGRAVRRRLLLGGPRGLGSPLARGRPPRSDGGHPPGVDQAGRRGHQGPRAPGARRPDPYPTRRRVFRFGASPRRAASARPRPGRVDYAGPRARR